LSATVPGLDTGHRSRNEYCSGIPVRSVERRL
jgi:hypothetical protein